MANDTNILIRIDKDTKEKAEVVFSKLGITLTDAVNMFINKAIMVQGLPFDVVLEPEFNDETKEAINEIIDMEKGNIPKNSQSVENLFNELNIDVKS